MWYISSDKFWGVKPIAGPKITTISFSDLQAPLDGLNMITSYYGEVAPITNGPLLLHVIYPCRLTVCAAQNIFLVSIMSF